MPLVDGVWNYTESDSLGPTFSSYMSLGTDSVRTELNELKADTGWVSLTLGGSIAGATGTIQYRVVGGLTVQVKIDLTGGTFASGTNYALTAVASPIPTAYRPASVAAGFGAVPLGPGYVGSVLVSTDGTITFQQNTGASRTSVRGTVTYLLG